jgi:hypothetical protein
LTARRRAFALSNHSKTTLVRIRSIQNQVFASTDSVETTGMKLITLLFSLLLACGVSRALDDFQIDDLPVLSQPGGADDAENLKYAIQTSSRDGYIPIDELNQMVQEELVFDYSVDLATAQSQIDFGMITALNSVNPRVAEFFPVAYESFVNQLSRLRITLSNGAVVTPNDDNSDDESCFEPACKRPRRGLLKSHLPDWDATFLRNVLTPQRSIDALEEIYSDPNHPLHDAINEYNAALFMTQHSTAESFLETVKTERMKLSTALGNVLDGKYKDRINMSDLITSSTELNVLKNYAPDSDVEYEDPTGGGSKVNKDNGCTRWYYWVLAKQMVQEVGSEWTDDLKQAVTKRLSITDYSKIVPFEKKTYQTELDEYSEGVGREVLDGLASMELATNAKYHFLQTGKPMQLLRASAYADKRVFDNASRQTTEWMDLLPPAIHGQVLCIQGALTLQPRNRLTEIQNAVEVSIGAVVNSARVELGMSPIVPNASFIERWGQGQLSDEEREAFRADQLEKLAKGRETQRIIRELAASGDPKCMEWVANNLRTLEKGRETQSKFHVQAAAGDAKAKKWVANKIRAQRETKCEIRKQAAAGDAKAKKWVANELRAQEKGRETMREFRVQAAAGDAKAKKWVGKERRAQEKGRETQSEFRKQAAAGDAKAKKWVANNLRTLQKGQETQSKIRLQAAAGNETAIAWQKKQLKNLNRGNPTGAKNRHNKAVAKAKNTVRQLAREGRFTLGSNGSILYQKRGESKTTPLTHKTYKLFGISFNHVNTAKDEVRAMWKETTNPFFKKGSA